MCLGCMGCTALWNQTYTGQESMDCMAGEVAREVVRVEEKVEEEAGREVPEGEMEKGEVVGKAREAWVVVKEVTAEGKRYRGSRSWILAGKSSRRGR